MILTWTIASILFAVIVHILFHIDGTGTGFEAKWGAGDILTYVSTVGLGLLAIWQNRKYKEDNDCTQKRLEDLTVRANELTAINKIIECERARIEQLKVYFDRFSKYCDPQYINEILASKSNFFGERSLAIDEWYNNSFEAYLELNRELSNDPVCNSSEIKKAVELAFTAILALHNSISSSPEVSPDLQALNMARMVFVGKRETYISDIDIGFNKLVYGNPSLEDIKRDYDPKRNKSEAEKNGQVEDAQR